MTSTSFDPDWISAPGDTIADILDDQGLSLLDLASHLGTDTGHAADLLHGQAALTPGIANRLEALFGAPAAFWLNRESRYREALNRLQQGLQTLSREQWLAQVPLKEMLAFGWLPPPARHDPFTASLRFFDSNTLGDWHATYRDVIGRAVFRQSASYRLKPVAVAAWLRQGELQASRRQARPLDLAGFKALLPDLRALTRQKDPERFLPELKAQCEQAGVLVEIVRTPAGASVSGATRYLASGRALIQLSFRHLTDDHFWFTFFHEAGHVLLHGDRTLFLEEPRMLKTKEEHEANIFAADLIVPEHLRAQLAGLKLSHLEVIRFARQAGIAPGLVVGQLQHQGRLPMNHLSRLKRRFKWL